MYRPLDVLSNVHAFLDGRPMAPMVPWVAGHRGEIELKGRGGFVSRGVATVVDPRTVEVSELPVGRWTDDYKKWLLNEQGEGRATWSHFTEAHTDTHVAFTLHGWTGTADGLTDALKLEASHSLRNMHGFDSAGVLRRVDSPLEVIEQFVPARLELYERRKAHQLAQLAREEALLAAKARFIGDVVAGEIEIARATKTKLFAALHGRGFAPQLEGAPPHAYGALTIGDGPTLDPSCSQPSPLT